MTQLFTISIKDSQLSLFINATKEILRIRYIDLQYNIDDF